MKYAKGRDVLKKKNKSQRSQKFKADMDTIKKEDMKRLQKTFIQFFGSDRSQISKQATKIRNKIYFFGFVSMAVFIVIFFLTKNVKFVGI